MKVVLGSVLKPVNDSRVYKKIGKSLAKLASSEILIVGTDIKDATPEEGNIKFYPIFKEKKKVVHRLVANNHFFRFLKKHQPGIIIIHTIELIPSIILFKYLHPEVKIIYDILENYPLNFTEQRYHKKYLSPILSFAAQRIENLCFKYVDHLFVAEKTYFEEKKLPINKATILENKYGGEIELRSFQPGKIHFLMCGSITKIFGAHHFLDFIDAVNKLKIEKYSFSIIGKAYEKDIIERIRIAELKYQNVSAIGIEEFVSHDLIIEKMLEANFVCLPYPYNKSTKGCIPTKMYECLALKIPMIINPNPLWENITNPQNAALYHDFTSDKVTDLLKKLDSYVGYKNSPDQIDPLWKSEEEKLLKVIQTL
ncbi:glycosyltransferase family 4 protein [Flammeovirga sp. MY04]|uniref:hypothetical protein n=1 Tax=Flammeovirga sp. MY04 TaxID=1191459 RepID=UPI00080616DF|nr:hypothetical protein [Flammeovirga sp. MY04]ANQ48452.1 glycosyltransferase family 4 protein [Flammeovirga sp. MY04]